jgi:hypothetical protein
MSGREERTQRLREAARRKTINATQRAAAAIDDLVAAHNPVTFRAVAREGGVSLDFLYGNHAIRNRIIELRTAERELEARPREEHPSTVVHALTLQLRQLRIENQELRRQIASLQGELLLVRRQDPERAVTGRAPPSEPGPPRHDVLCCRRLVTDGDWKDLTSENGGSPAG